MYNETCHCNACMQQRFNTTQAGYNLNSPFHGYAGSTTKHVEPHRSQDQLQLDAITELTKAIKELTAKLPARIVGPR